MQKTVIYIDVLVLLNLFVNYLLLLSVNRILRRKRKEFRLFLSALLGGLCSLTILLPRLSPLLLLSEKLLLSFLMVGIAFGFRPPRRLIYQWILFFGISFLYGGITFALWYFVSPGGMIYQNGVAYYPISALALALFTIAAYLIFWLLENLWQKRVPQKQQATLRIDCNGSEVLLHGLGPFFDTMEPVDDPLWQKRLRVVPLNSVVGKGVLPAFRPDRFTLAADGGKEMEKQVLIAVTDQPISGGEVEAIISDTLLS